jgi:hypothetical protein
MEHEPFINLDGEDIELRPACADRDQDDAPSKNRARI